MFHVEQKRNTALANDPTTLGHPTEKTKKPANAGFEVKGRLKNPLQENGCSGW